MTKPYIFVSHASEDNPRLRPILRELARRGVPLWIDRPYDETLDLPESDFAGCIKRGGSGEITYAMDQIRDAAVASFGILVFPSNATARSQQVAVEIGIGIGQNARSPEEFLLLSCFLDSVAFQASEWRMSNIQGYATSIIGRDGTFELTEHGHKAVGELADSILAHVAKMRSEGRVREVRRMQTDVPYLADRAEQTTALLAEELWPQSPEYVPLLTIASGPDEEEHLGFLSRTLPDLVFSKCSWVKVAAASRRPVSVEFPDGDAAKLDKKFNRVFKTRLAAAFLGANPETAERPSGLDMLADRFSRDGIVRIVSTTLSLENADLRAASQSVRQWVGFWEEFDFQRIKPPAYVLPVLLIGETSSADGPAVRRFFRLPARTRKYSLLDMQDDIAAASIKVRPLVLPRLEKVTLKHVRSWVFDSTCGTFDRFGPSDRQVMFESLAACFGKNAALSMRDWRKRASAHF